jgi:AP-4 complex subunit sigma-1
LTPVPSELCHRPLLQAHYILDEMVMNGSIVETNKANILTPLALLEKSAT